MSQREGEVRCVFQIWYHIICPSGTLCVPGLTALFLPDSSVLVLDLTLWTTLYTLLTHQIIPTHTQVKAMTLLLYLFIRMATSFYVVWGYNMPLIHFWSHSLIRGTQDDLELLISIIHWSVLFHKSHKRCNVCCNFSSCHEYVCLSLCPLRRVIPDSPWLRGQPATLSHPALTTPQSKQTYCPPSAQEQGRL